MNRVLVTGGWGFIGSNFVKELFLTLCAQDGKRVSDSGGNDKPLIVQVDKGSYCSRAEYIEDIPGVINYKIDLNDTEQLEDILFRHNIDTLVHFAAQSHVDLSFNNSLTFTWDNVRGTHSLLEATRRYKRIKRFLHISTDEVYGETIQKTPFDEQTPPNPTNPYAATKISAEFLVQSYYHCFEIPVLMIRGNNVYGPHQYPEKLIPRFIFRLLDGEACPVHGNGQTRRNFIHVTDMCRAIITVLNKGTISEVYNIGNHNEHSVLQVARHLVDLIVSPDAPLQNYLEFQQDRYYNDFTYRIDSSKLRALGWEPKIDMEEGLRTTIEWYRHNRTLYKGLEGVDDT